MFVEGDEGTGFGAEAGGESVRIKLWERLTADVGFESIAGDAEEGLFFGGREGSGFVGLGGACRG